MYLDYNYGYPLRLDQFTGVDILSYAGKWDQHYHRYQEGNQEQENYSTESTEVRLLSLPWIKVKYIFHLPYKTKWLTFLEYHISSYSRYRYRLQVKFIVVDVLTNPGTDSLTPTLLQLTQYWLLLFSSLRLPMSTSYQIIRTTWLVEIMDYQHRGKWKLIEPSCSIMWVDDSSLPWIIPNFLIHNGSAAGFMLRCWYKVKLHRYRYWIWCWVEVHIVVNLLTV